MNILSALVRDIRFGVMGIGSVMLVGCASGSMQEDLDAQRNGLRHQQATLASLERRIADLEDAIVSVDDHLARTLKGLRVDLARLQQDQLRHSRFIDRFDVVPSGNDTFARTKKPLRID
ncbi:MAG: hypothetical protein AAF493_07920 [Pseudomonadota bacterium]